MNETTKSDKKEEYMYIEREKAISAKVSFYLYSSSLNIQKKIE